MQASNLDAVLGRAMRDEKFRTTLLSDPDSVAKEYKLSESDLGQLKKIDQAAASQFFQGVLSSRSKIAWSTDKTCYEHG